MIGRLLLPAMMLAASVRAQRQEPVFYSWHAFEYAVYEKPERELTAQFHFRTRDHFSKFALVRYSVFGTQSLPKKWSWTAGYLQQNQEVVADQEWTPQQRVFASLSRPWRTRRLQHSPRFQYDYLFDMAVPSYGRVRLAWQTEWIARFRPYAGAEEFVERRGVQRFRPRVGVRFSPASHMDADIVYMYDRIYLRGLTNRHILQTTLNFHRAKRD